MREILFRGKRKDNREWIEGGIYYQKLDNVKEEAIYIIGSSLNDVSSAYEVIPSSIGQYTGLTDKNDKRIFEGDIVAIDNAKEEKFVITFGVCGGVANCEKYGYMGFYLKPYNEIAKSMARYGLRNDPIYFELEVIGNIHDGGINDGKNSEKD